MDSIKKFVKNHKVITTLIILFIIALIALIVLYNLMFVYHEDTRLKGKKEVEISAASLKSIEQNLAKKDEFSSVETNLVTRQLTFLIDIKEDTDKKYAKELSADVLAELSEKEKEYYDIQVIYQCSACDKDDNTYPIIGYKNKKNDDFIWSNN